MTWSHCYLLRKNSKGIYIVDDLESFALVAILKWLGVIAIYLEKNNWFYIIIPLSHYMIFSKFCQCKCFSVNVYSNYLNVRTFKCECPSKLILRADRKKNKLVIIFFVKDHNHHVSQDKYNAYPEEILI